MLIFLYGYTYGKKEYAANIQLLKNADINSPIKIGHANMVPFNDSYLEMEPVEVKYVKNKYECIGACALTMHDCKSTNFYKNFKDNFTCEILDVDKYMNRSFFVHRSHTTHFAIQVCNIFVTTCFL